MNPTNNKDAPNQKYQTIADSLLPHLPQGITSLGINAAIQSIPFEPTRAKAFLKLFRLGSIPREPRSAAYRDTLPAMEAISELVNNTEAKNREGSVFAPYFQGGSAEHDIFPQHLQSTIRGSGVYLCLLNDLDEQQRRAARRASFFKEVDVMRSRRSTFLFNLSAFLDGEGNLSPFYPTNQSSLRDISRIFDKFTSIIRRNTLYPTMSRKLLPSRTIPQLERFSVLMKEEYPFFSQRSLERLYVATGILLDGPCEMKQRWYTNGQTPRTYFVCGPTAYNKSKLMKKPFNLLCSLIPASNKFKRVDVTRFSLTEGKSAAMYDFVSFTSNFGVQVGFLYTLAEEYRGVEVEVLDGRIGYHMVSLGGLFKEYAESCNDFPEWYTEEPGIMESEVERHQVAGFLGVTGNIASCTSLHALFLRTLVTSWDECGVAGDDAFFIYTIGEVVWEMMGILSEIGILHHEKTHLWIHSEALYLKRGLEYSFLKGHFLLKEYIQIPSLLFKIENAFLDRYREAFFPVSELYRLAARSLHACYSSADRQVLSSSEIESFKSWLEGYYKDLDLPQEGFIPGVDDPTDYPRFRKRYRDLLIPAIHTFGSGNYRENTLRHRWRGSFSQKDFLEQVQFVWEDIRNTSRFAAYQTPELSYLLGLGVLERDASRVSETWTGPVGWERAREKFVLNPRDLPRKLIVFSYVGWLDGLTEQLAVHEMCVLDGSHSDILRIIPEPEIMDEEEDSSDDDDLEEGEISDW